MQKAFFLVIFCKKTVQISQCLFYPFKMYLVIIDPRVAGSMPQVILMEDTKSSIGVSVDDCFSYMWPVIYG